MKRLITAIFSTVLIAGLVGVAGAYEEVAVTDGGAIAGVVKFAGKAPQADPLPVTKNPEVCGAQKPSEALLVSNNGGLKNVVVSLEKIAKGKKIDQSSPSLENKTCGFGPHVQAVAVGSKLEVRNADPILHNTHSYVEGKTFFNLALPVQGQKVKKEIKKAGLIDVKCDAGHTWMRAYIVAKDHPYFAVTDKSGAYKITDVPPGTYKVQAWHEGWKVTGKDKDGRLEYEAPHVQTKDATVSSKGEVKVDFEFK